jgi:tetratricopeptide (TPR) repeat protein
MKHSVLIIFFIFSSLVPLFASYDDALKLFDEKKYRESLKLIADQLDVKKDADPASPNYKLRYLAAHIHWKLGNYEYSLMHFKKCMQIKPESEDPYIDASLMLISAKKYTDAEYMVNRGLEIKKSPMLYFVYGKIAMRNENYWKAKEMLEKAIALEPELYAAYNSLGITLMKLNRPSEANTAFSAALSVNPNSAEIMNNLGFSFMALGKYDISVKYFEKATLIDPENETIKANLQYAKSKTGK